MKDMPRLIGPVDAVRSVGTVAGDIVHALKNPVSAFRTSLGLLGAAHLDADDRATLMRVMKNELTKLGEMLERCGELAKLDELASAPCRLDEIVRTCVERRVAEAQARGATASVHLDEAAIVLDGDAAQLTAAIDALLSNALEASGAGGRVDVTVAAVGDGRALLEVRDDGAGIDPSVLPNVFRLMFTTRKGAAGMGLSIAQFIFLAHGGRLVLESEPGNGAVARVVLPVR